MPNRSSKPTSPKRPRNPDVNQLARFIVDAATGETQQDAPPMEAARPEKNPAAVALGKLGGKKGGRARALALTPEQRQEIARVAASTRWKKSGR